MRIFFVQVNGKNVKKLVSTSKNDPMKSIYNQFNKYSKSKGYVVACQNRDSFGGLAWGKPEDNGQQTLLVGGNN